MGFGSFLKKMINPINAIKSSHKLATGIGKAGIKATKQGLRGNIKGSLKAGLDGLSAGADFAQEMSPIKIGLAQFLRKRGLGQQPANMNPSTQLQSGDPGGAASALASQIANVPLDKGMGMPPPEEDDMGMLSQMIGRPRF